MSKADIVFLSVKPGQVRGVLEEISSEIEGKLLISVAAAVSTVFLESLAPGARVIRAMPNINVIVGASATAITKGKSAREEDLEIAKKLFSYMGEVVVVEEKYLDAITAFSGSGPAYVLQFYESLLLAGLKIGLPREVAQDLALYTIIGTAKLLEATSGHPAELRDMVITPGGVTIEGIYVMEESGFKAIVMNAIERACEKSKKIAEILNGQE